MPSRLKPLPPPDLKHRDLSELSTIFPSSLQTLDSYAFSPCGYSANALVRAPSPPSSSSTDQEGYWTVHVTPEAGHSYASFETNISFPLGGGGGGSLASSLATLPPSSPPRPNGVKEADFPNLLTLVRRVVGIFEPGRFTITLFVESKPVDVGDDEDEEEGWGKTAGILGSKGLVPGYRRKDRFVLCFGRGGGFFVCWEKD